MKLLLSSKTKCKKERRIYKSKCTFKEKHVHVNSVLDLKINFGRLIQLKLGDLG